MIRVKLANGVEIECGDTEQLKLILDKLNIKEHQQPYPVYIPYQPVHYYKPYEYMPYYYVTCGTAGVIDRYCGGVVTAE